MAIIIKLYPIVRLTECTYGPYQKVADSNLIFRPTDCDKATKYTHEHHP